MRPIFINIHERPLNCVTFNHDGDFFLTSSKDGEICLFNSDTCERMGTYDRLNESAKSSVATVDITIDSQYVVACYADGKLVFFNFQTGEQLSSVNHGGVLKFCEWNQKPGAQNMVVTCNDKFKSQELGAVPNRIMVWRFHPCERLLSIDDKLPMKASKVKWGPFDETLVSIFEEGTIWIWDSKDGAPIKTIDAHLGIITSLNFTSDRMLMITSSKDNTAKLWAMDKYELVKTYKSDRALNDAVISPLYNMEADAKMHILMGGGQDAKDVTTTSGSSGKFEVLLWHMVYEEELGTIKGGFGPMNTIAWRRDGRGYVTGGEDGYVRSHMFDTDYFTSKKFE